MGTVSAGEDRIHLTFLGRGDGTFDEPTAYVWPWFVVSAAVSDFDGEGGSDIAAGVFGIFGSYISVLLNQTTVLQ